MLILSHAIFVTCNIRSDWTPLLIQLFLGIYWINTGTFFVLFGSASLQKNRLESDSNSIIRVKDKHTKH